jgi:glycosyltransferase involved in cell wall biosynthesis
VNPILNNPLISIIIRTYNNENTIFKSVNSALIQDYENFEILIINDGSTDKTAEIINSISDSNVRIIYQQNSGAISAAYMGIDHAKGDYITFLDADDELTRDAIDSLYQPLKYNKYGFSYCDYLEINLETEASEYISISNLFNIMVCGVMFKRIVIDKIGFWDKSFILPEHDYIIRVARKYQGIHINKPLYKYYRHSNSMTADKDLVKKAKEQIFNKYGFIKDFKDYSIS